MYRPRPDGETCICHLTKSEISQLYVSLEVKGRAQTMYT